MKNKTLLKLSLLTLNLAAVANAIDFKHSVNLSPTYLDIDESNHTDSETRYGATLSFESATPIIQDLNLLLGWGIDFLNQSGNIYFLNTGLSYNFYKKNQIKFLASYNLKNDADYQEYGTDNGLGYEVILLTPLYEKNYKEDINLFISAKRLNLTTGLSRTMNRYLIGLNAPF